MNTIKLYGPREGSSLRGHWALAEAGLEYQSTEVPREVRKQPEFLAINPMGQVPALIDGDVVLAESLAIAHYVIKKYKPELLGNPTEEAQALRWSVWGFLNPQRSFLDLARQKWNNTNDEVAIAKAKEELEKSLPILDAWLTTHHYITGDTFTFGDISVGVTISYSAFWGFDYSVYKNIVRWMSEVTTRPAYLKAKGTEA